MKKLLLIILFVAFGLLIVFLLYVSSRSSIDQKNGFNRTFNNIGIKKLNEFDLKFANYYISGITNSNIFLGNHKATLHGVMISADLRDTVHINNPNFIKDTIDIWAIKVQIDSPNVYYMERMTPAYAQAILPFAETKRIDLNDIKFDRIKVISKNSFVIRYFQSKHRVLQKITIQPTIKRKGIFRLSDGINNDFALDGYLAYNKATGKLIYINYYSNKFICLDTNMNFVYIGNTIDTNRIAKIKVAEINKTKTKEKLMSAPPLQVNKRGYADGKWLYIQSLLASDQEPLKQFNTYTVIDIYHIENGKYSHSIQVPNINDKKLTDFIVLNNKLYALYDHYMVSYEIH
ncbi:hypothetical protein HDC92_001399 [Pedobacter sp. AK017]|uniref:hypothetical protein n=1 Tax=Pedobacter sp. AK017 TaxID=2723073 RepID=UPI0016136777|nr:hypothetical protein [Pedobacter sp. AK017]MBB5437725.1 hypothetical protein [Pedobacter sp. AK017]